MAVDGTLEFNTRIDTSGVEEGTEKISQTAEQAGKEVENTVKQVEEAVKNCDSNIKVSVNTDQTEADNVRQCIQEILDDAERSNQSKASSIAAIYRQMGMDMSEAMSEAWSCIERGPDVTNSTSKKIKATVKEVDKEIEKSINKNESGISSGIKNISGGLESLKSGFKKVAAAAAAAFSINAIKNFAGECKALYNVQLEAETKLGAVLKGHLGATDDQIQSIKDYASELQSVGVIGDEVQLSGLQELSTYMESAENLKPMLSVLDDMLAQQYGLNATAESAVTISTMLGKVLEGQTSALSRYGYSFTEAQEQLLKYGTEEQRVATLAEVVSSSVGGMNEALAKTNSGRLTQLSNTMGDIKEQFGSVVTQIEVLFLPALNKVASTLGNIATLAEKLAQSLANLFGASGSSANTLASGVSGITDEIANSVSEQNALTDAVNETAEAQENALAGFDKINKLSDSSESTDTDSVTAVTVSVNTVPAVTDIEEAENEIIGKLRNLFAPLQEAWNAYGKPLTDSIKTTWQNIKSVMQSVGDSFGKVWSNGTGYTTVSQILQIFTNISDTIGNISGQLAFAWDSGSGTRIVQALADNFNIILGTINDITFDTAEWAETLDFVPLLESIAGLLEALKPLNENIGSGLEWFYKNVLLPLSSWVIEDAVPAFLDILSGAIDVLNSVIEALKPLGKWLYDKFLKPISEWTGGIIVDILEGVAGALKKLSDWISEHQTAVQDFAIVVGILGASFKIAGIITEAMTALTAIGGVMGVLTTITTALGGAFAFLTSPITLIVLAIGAVIAVGLLLVKHWDEVKEFAVGLWESIQETLWSFFDWVVEKFEALVSFFSGVWDSICIIFSMIGNWFKDKFTEAWNGITGAFSSVKTWFKSRLDDIHNVFASIGAWFKDKFTTAWNNIKSTFSTVGSFFRQLWTKIKSPFTKAADWFKDIFTNAKDSIVSAFETLSTALKTPLNWVIDLVNSVIGKINNFSIDLPGWAVDIVGVDHIGFNIPEIPHLAQGTVVPANYGEFLAVLGDNKRESEVVSPVSTIEKAVENVLSRRGDGDINLNVILDGKTIYKMVVKKNNESIRMTGKNPLVSV